MEKILKADMEYIVSLVENWTELRDSTVLITGASGLIGSLLIRAFVYASDELNLNIRIIGHSRDTTLLKADAELLKVIFLEGDIQKSIDVEDHVDYIIHCASITDSKLMIEKPTETFLTSVIGTKNVLDLAVDKRVKSFVYISSMEMYGDISRCDIKAKKKADSIDKVSENMLGYLDLGNTRNSYPEGKRAAECLCHAYLSEYGVPIKIARLSQTFGAGVKENEKRVFAQFARSIVLENDIVLHTDGKSEGNYCYLADTIYGIIMIMIMGKKGEPYNIVNEKLHMTIYEMAEYVVNKLARRETKIIISSHDAGYGYAVPTKLKLSGEKLMELGWKPRFDMTDMYSRMLEYWQERSGLAIKK